MPSKVFLQTSSPFLATPPRSPLPPALEGLASAPAAQLPSQPAPEAALRVEELEAEVAGWRRLGAAAAARLEQQSAELQAWGRLAELAAACHSQIGGGATLVGMSPDRDIDAADVLAALPPFDSPARGAGGHSHGSLEWPTDGNSAAEAEIALTSAESEIAELRAGQAVHEREHGRREAQAASIRMELATARADAEHHRARRTKAEEALLAERRSTNGAPSAAGHAGGKGTHPVLSPCGRFLRPKAGGY